MREALYRTNKCFLLQGRNACDRNLVGIGFHYFGQVLEGWGLFCQDITRPPDVLNRKLLAMTGLFFDAG